jgi:hypothetical protein
MMPISIKLCEGEEEWDSFVSMSHNGTLFHRWGLLKLMEKHSYTHILGKKYPGKFLPLVGYNNETPIGLYPVFVYKTPFIASAFSPPLGSGAIYQGPIHFDRNMKQSTKEEYSLEFQKNIDEYLLREFDVNLIKIRTSPGIIDCRAFYLNDYLVEPFYTYEIDVSKPLGDVWGSFDGTLRKNVKKTSSSGVTVREGTRDEILLLFNALKDRMIAQGLDSEFDYDYLIEVYDLFYPKNIKLVVTEKDGKYLTGLMLLFFGKKVIAWIGIARSVSPGIYPNDLLVWDSIKWAHENGYETFEIMWANTDRLNKYKSKFNPDATIYFSCYRMPMLLTIYDYFKRNKKRGRY